MSPALPTVLLRTQSDARLVELARGGHDRAFEAIVERYRRPLHAYCRRFLPEARAEDAVQQAFLNAWNAVRTGSEVRELRPWLYRITHNAALNAAKRSGYDYDELHESLRHAEGPDAALERRLVIRQTLTGLAALPERQRAALLQTAVEGRSHEAVARDLGLTDGAVRQLVHRARTSLRAAATALTPMPLVTWLAAAAPGSAAGGGERIAQLATGAGGAGIAGLLTKSGAAVLVTGTLVTGGATTLRHRETATPRPAAAVRHAASAIRPAPASAAALPVSVRRSAPTAKASSSHGRSGGSGHGRAHASGAQDPGRDARHSRAEGSDDAHGATAPSERRDGGGEHRDRSREHDAPERRSAGGDGGRDAVEQPDQEPAHDAQPGEDAPPAPEPDHSGPSAEGASAGEGPPPADEPVEPR